MSGTDALNLIELLTERDLAILRTLRTHRLASTTQLRRWHFTELFTHTGTATRATQRILARLEGHRLVARLTQRIGGVRRGSDSVVWQLAATGDRLVSVVDGDQRRRYIEPRGTFTRHTVAVTELALQLIEAVRTGTLDQAAVTAEPDCWHRFAGAHGRAETLKPDLAVVTAVGEWEDHLFVERDLATEHPTVVVRKAHGYERFAATGTYQAAHGVFPAVLWVVPDASRQQALERALRSARGLTTGVHRVITYDQFVYAVVTGADPLPGDDHTTPNPPERTPSS